MVAQTGREADGAARGAVAAARPGAAGPDRLDLHRYHGRRDAHLSRRRDGAQLRPDQVRGFSPLRTRLELGFFCRVSGVDVDNMYLCVGDRGTTAPRSTGVGWPCPASISTPAPIWAKWSPCPEQYTKPDPSPLLIVQVSETMKHDVW